MHAAMTFWKQKSTRLGLAAALMFLLVFSLVWMTGYDGVSDQVKQLRIGIVSEDQERGPKIAEEIAKTLPFQIDRPDAKETGMDMLERNEMQMLIVIPADFSRQLQTPGVKASLSFVINEANPSMVKTTMQSVAAGVTASVNKQAVATGATAVLTQMKVPAEQAGKVAASLSERVTGDVQALHPVNSFSDQMVPMMLVMATWVGSMVLSLFFNQSQQALQGIVACKWKRFGILIGSKIVSSLLLGLVATAMVLGLGDFSETGFLSVWGFLSVVYLTSMIVSQLFLLLIGLPGMVFNILLLAGQMVTSGALVPRVVLPDFYQSVSQYLPATYVAEGAMKMLFGGKDAGHDLAALGWILLVAFAASLLVVLIKKQKQKAETIEKAA